MKNVRKIYIKLLDEGLDVWRPVEAIQLEGLKYRLLDLLDNDGYDSEDEVWEFEPGSIVMCEMRKLSDGMNLVAVEKVE